MKYLFESVKSVIEFPVQLTKKSKNSQIFLILSDKWINSSLRNICTLCCISLGSCFGAEIRVIINVSKNPCYPTNVDLFLLGWSKNIFFWKKKIPNGRFKTTEIFNSSNSQYFFIKISWIGPWVSRINWCEGHWYGSTSMVVRLSKISSKIGKKCIFCVFRPFLSLCRTASQPDRLSHINALCINQSY